MYHPACLLLVIGLSWRSCFFFWKCNFHSIVDKDFLARRCDNEVLLAVYDGDPACSHEQLDFLHNLSWLVFLDHVAAVADDFHLILALHVGHCQLSIHALRPGQEQTFLRLQSKEALS